MRKGLTLIPLILLTLSPIYLFLKPYKEHENVKLGDWAQSKTIKIINICVKYIVFKICLIRVFHWSLLR